MSKDYPDAGEVWRDKVFLDKTYILGVFDGNGGRDVCHVFDDNGCPCYCETFLPEFIRKYDYIGKAKNPISTILEV